MVNCFESGNLTLKSAMRGNLLISFFSMSLGDSLPMRQGMDCALAQFRVVALSPIVRFSERILLEC